MNIIDAMILLGLSPIESRTALEVAYESAIARNLPGVGDAYRVLTAFLITHNNFADAIETPHDLNKILVHTDPQNYPRIFQSIAEKLPKIGKTKGTLITILTNLSPSARITAVDQLRLFLPNFDQFITEKLNLSPPKLTVASVATRAMAGKMPEGDRVVMSIFGQSLGPKINRSYSWLTGLDPIHAALQEGLTVNKIQASLTQNSFFSKKSAQNFASALLLNNEEEIRGSYEALMHENSRTFSDSNVIKIGQVAGAMIALTCSLCFRCESMAGYPATAAQVISFLYLANAIYQSKNFLLSIKQNETVEQRRTYLVDILSHMEEPLLLRLTQALGLRLSPEELRSPESVKVMLSAYNWSDNVTTMTEDIDGEEWEVVDPSTAADHLGEGNEEDLDSPRSQGSSPPSF